MKETRFFRFEITDDVFLVVLPEQICNAPEAELMRDAHTMIGEFNDSSAAHAVVDFSTIEYFSSVVLEALLHFWKAVESRQGRMALCELSSVGREIIEVSHLERLWPVCNTRDQALQAVRTPQQTDP